MLPPMCVYADQWERIGCINVPEFNVTEPVNSDISGTVKKTGAWLQYVISLVRPRGADPCMCPHVYLIEVY